MQASITANSTSKDRGSNPPLPANHFLMKQFFIGFASLAFSGLAVLVPVLWGFKLWTCLFALVFFSISILFFPTEDNEQD